MSGGWATRHVPAAVAAAVVAVLWLVPEGRLGESLEAWRWLEGADPGVGADKVIHFGVFSLLAVLAHRSLGELAPSFRPRPLLSGLITLVYGLLLEGLQLLVPERSFEVADGAANALGVVAATLALAAVVRFRDRQVAP